VRRLRANRLAQDHSLPLCPVVVSGDGKTVITNGDGLRGWDPATDKQRFGPAGETGYSRAVVALTFASDGKEIVSLGDDSTLFHWDVATGRVLSTRSSVGASSLWRTSGGMRSATADWSQLTIQDALTGKALGQVKFPDDRTPRAPNTQWRYALLGDGRTVLTYFPRQDKAAVMVTDYTTSRCLSQAAVPLPPPWGMFQAFSPCGLWLVAYGTLFDVRSGARLWTPAADATTRLRDEYFATFLPDGRLLCGQLKSYQEQAEQEEQEVNGVWEVASGALVHRFSAKHAGQVAFGPDNRTLAYVTGWGVQLLDFITARPLASYENPDVNCDSFDLTDTARTLVLSPAGHLLATGHHDGSVGLWKVPQPTPVQRTQADLEAAWNLLGSGDGTKARLGIDQLTHDPELATALLTRKFKPPAAPVAAEVPKLIQALDSAEFATRDQATRTLRALGHRAEPQLKEALQTATPEMKRRIQLLLEALENKRRLPLDGEALRGVRAIEVLEQIGTQGARELLQAWAEQSADPRLATEARMALDRRGRR
jgi:WD40 repeat protein